MFLFTFLCLFYSVALLILLIHHTFIILPEKMLGKPKKTVVYQGPTFEPPRGKTNNVVSEQV